MTLRLGVLVSGGGTNLQAILDAVGEGRLDAEIRVVLSNKPDVFALPPVAEYGHRLVLDLYPVIPLDPLMAFLEAEAKKDKKIAAAPPRPDRGPPAHAPGTPERKITIAIDPGHGGEDPGAIGRRGTYEKHVTLAIARKLKARIDGDRNMRAMLTRDDDYFVPLHERVQKARRVQADLFVSIHADAFREPAARGSSGLKFHENSPSSIPA